MKSLKKALVIMVSLLFMIGLVGCGSSGSKVATDNSGAKTTFAVPGQPDRKAEVYGKVKSIQGNLITVMEMEQTLTGQELSDKDREKRRQEMQNLSPEERKKKIDGEQTFTGKTLTVTIPVGIPVMTKKDQNPAANFEEGNIGNIKMGNTVTIWTENQQKDNSTAEFVKFVVR